METILQVLMNRDSMEKKEALILINHAKIQLNEYLDDGDTFSASNICEEFFGLEEDYIMELM
jgi:hypothetical protein